MCSICRFVRLIGIGIYFGKYLFGLFLIIGNYLGFVCCGISLSFGCVIGRSDIVSSWC